MTISFTRLQNHLVQQRNLIEQQNPKVLIIDESNWNRSKNTLLSTVYDRISGHLINNVVRIVQLKNRRYCRLASFLHLKFTRFGPTIISVPPGISYKLDISSFSDDKLKVFIDFFDIVVQADFVPLTKLSERSFTLIFSSANTHKYRHEISNLLVPQLGLTQEEDTYRFCQRTLPFLILKCDALIIHPHTYECKNFCSFETDSTAVVLTREQMSMKIVGDVEKTSAFLNSWNT